MPANMQEQGHDHDEAAHKGKMAKHNNPGGKTNKNFHQSDPALGYSGNLPPSESYFFDHFPQRDPNAFPELDDSSADFGEEEEEVHEKERRREEDRRRREEERRRRRMRDVYEVEEEEEEEEEYEREEEGLYRGARDDELILPPLPVVRLTESKLSKHNFTTTTHLMPRLNLDGGNNSSVVSFATGRSGKKISAFFPRF
jgi:hypothetical protein